MLYRALETFVRDVPATGTALILPGREGVSRWRLEYAGEVEKEMRSWLEHHLEDSLEVTLHNLSSTWAPCSPREKPQLFSLHPQAPPMAGAWVVWPYKDLGFALPAEELESFRAALETLLEVEHREQLNFRNPSNPLESDLANMLRHGDEQALPALLGLARTVGEADFTYWGKVHDEAVDVEWHLGASDRGFGFELPLGHGVGGRAFARDEVFQVTDYRNCQYRYPGVSEITDSEEVRSVLAIPIHSEDSDKGAILYAVRRAVDAFSPSERILLHRLASSLEPVPGLWPTPRYFFSSGKDHLKSAKSGLREMLLNSSQVQDIESWLEQLVRGPAILVDGRGRPYVRSNADRLERLTNTSSRRSNEPRTVRLTGSPTAVDRGRLHLWPSVELPLDDWPDLLEDVAAACNIIIDRGEQSYDRFNHQRSRWLDTLLEGKTDLQSRREGKRLGLPIDRGEVWAVAWDVSTNRAAEQTHLKVLAEDVILDLLGSPFITLEGGVGILLLGDPPRIRPAHLRDELLRIFEATSFWLVHGARYDSFGGLENALLQSINTIQRVRREDDERYISEVNSGGLDSLLENPNLSQELSTFADNLFKPILSYDEGHGTQLTETLCLSLTSNSIEEAARRLFVHANTVRYRRRRAEHLLGQDLAKPKEHTAASLAAYVWLHRRPDAPGSQAAHRSGQQQ